MIFRVPLTKLEPFKNDNPTKLKRKRRSIFQQRNLFDDSFYSNIKQMSNDLFDSIYSDFFDPTKMMKKLLNDLKIGISQYSPSLKYKYSFPFTIGDQSNDINLPNNEENVVEEGAIYLKNYNDVS